MARIDDIQDHLTRSISLITEMITLGDTLAAESSANTQLAQNIGSQRDDLINRENEVKKTREMNEKELYRLGQLGESLDLRESKFKDEAIKLREQDDLITQKKNELDAKGADADIVLKRSAELNKWNTELIAERDMLEKEKGLLRESKLALDMREKKVTEQAKRLQNLMPE